MTKEKKTNQIKELHLIRNVWYMTFKSSNIRDAAYNPRKEILYLRFKTQKESECYVYNGVDIKWWLNFTLAKSKGKFFDEKKDDLEDFYKVEVKNKE